MNPDYYTEPEERLTGAEIIRRDRNKLKDKLIELEKQRIAVEQEIFHLQNFTCQHLTKVTWVNGGQCSDCGRKL